MSCPVLKVPIVLKVLKLLTCGLLGQDRTFFVIFFCFFSFIPFLFPSFISPALHAGYILPFGRFVRLGR